MSGLGWLTARPIAHRGLHDAAAGVIENTASAFSAAIARGYGIECDLQISADGEAMVYHDEALGRLTAGNGRLAEMRAVEIRQACFKESADRIMTLGELCDLVAGHAALVIELKSHFDGDRRLVRRVVDVLGRYRGRVAVMSFDPGMIELVRSIAPQLTRGLVAEHHHAHNESGALPVGEKHRMAWLLHIIRTRPQFLAYAVRDLPAAVPLIARAIFRLPLLTWTVRNEADRARGVRWADQIIFEGWRP